MPPSIADVRKKIAMYRKTSSGKGFFQHGRLLFDSPLHLKGVCSGASKTWLSYYFLSGSDVAFWREFGSPLASHRAMVSAQDDTHQYTMGITLTQTITATRPDSAALWQPISRSNFKYYNCSFSNNTAHAMAGYAPGSAFSGSLFDPNLGQFDIDSKHYMKWVDLWKDLWDFYGISQVTVFNATGTEVLVMD